ncbi:MAG: glycosyltransferase family 4 protein [Pirellula sp.]
MKIGIWCDYGVTLQPSEGIGVFVANLVRGLIQLESVETCLLVSKFREEHLLEELEQLGGGKVQVVGNPPTRLLLRRPLRILRRHRRARQYAGRAPSWLEARLERCLSWLERNANPSQRRMLEQVDVWLLPYVGLDQSFPGPMVVVVHDLVTFHFPNSVSEKRLVRFKHLVREVTDQATLVACMSNFILQHDLRSTLGLPESKTRMVPVAIPEDFGEAGSQSPLPPSLLGKRYLLYPAAFREYKNHSLLVDALAMLHASGATDWRVVFTGISECPDSLKQHIAQSSVADAIHVLGRVPRSELETLYRKAFATVVPSLYEQGSFPLMEALHFGCPILISDIPSLREQFAMLGDSGLFFDPYKPERLIESLRILEARREALLESQIAGFRAMQKRTWKDAARDWIAVLSEAVEIDRPSNHC